MEQRPLYWKDVDAHVREESPMGVTYNHHVKKELRSGSPNVEKVWLWGSTGPGLNSPIIMYLSILGTEGQRFEKQITPEQSESLDIPEAIDFIQSL